MFYDSFVSLCEDRGVSPSKVLDALGMSRGSLFRWKNGGAPRNEYKKKIADYFGITVPELMSGKINTAPAEAEADDDEMAELLEAIRRRPDLKVLFSLSKKATPEDVKKTIKIIKTICGDDDGTDNF